MDAATVLSQLKSEGTAQNRKTYGRHRVPEPLYGVSYANLNKLKKQLGTDHELALELWASGIHDARILATMIADPAQISVVELDGWMREANNQVLADAVARVAAAHQTSGTRIKKWTAAKSEQLSAAGYTVLSLVAMHDTALPDEYFRSHLGTIKQSLHEAPNYTRHAMNQAVIAIGTRNPVLQKEAIAVARSVGKVEVDHGQTSCKTPDAEAYILKTVNKRKEQAAKRRAKSK